MNAHNSFLPAIDAAESFLAPVLSRGKIEKARQLSIIDRLDLSEGNQSTEDIQKRTSIIKRAISLLLNICEASNETPSAEASARSRSAAEIVYEPSVRRVLYGLLDLISLEGIYPALSPGVGIPLERRVKSVLPAGVVARTPDAQGPTISEDAGRYLLEATAFGLTQSLGSGSPELQTLIRERSLVDLIAACVELACNPSRGNRSRETHFRNLLEEALEKTPTPFLLPVLTCLLHPSTPIWARLPVSTPLSLLPLRPHGVRYVIEFIATTSPSNIPSTNNTHDHSTTAQSLESRQPLLDLEALTQASRLLSSPPSSLDANTYFADLAPQLFSLLDGEDGPEMAKVAGFVIGGGILGKRKHGAPGSAGWRLFAEPVLSMIDPSRGTAGQDSASVPPKIPSSTAQAVTDQQLSLALQRLSTLVSSHPNPGLTKRLVGAVMLPLWGISCLEHGSEKTCVSDQSLSLLQTFFKISAEDAHLVRLSENLLFDGRQPSPSHLGWVYTAGGGGGAAIQWKDSTYPFPRDIVAYIEDVDRRIERFVGLLSSGIISGDRMGAVFLAMTRRWLEATPTNSAQQNRLDDLGQEDDGKHSLDMLVKVKVLQKMMERVKDELGHNATQLLELVRQLLHDSVERDRERTDKKIDLSKPSSTALRSIVQSAEQETQRTNHASPEASTAPQTELVSMALSLLSALLSSPNFDPEEKDQALCASIKTSLDHISAAKDIFTTASTTAGNLSTLLEYHSSFSDGSKKTTLLPDHILEDRKTHSLSLTYLADTLLPVRAQGLSLLTSLISSSSPILDIPNTTTLLISLLQDSDEYIYLNAIKSLSLVATKHSRTVTKILVEQYVDREELLTLDQRLRLGEALLRTLHALGEALVGETAGIVGEGCLSIAGRRGERLKAQEQKEQRARLEAEKIREADEAWGGEAPQLNDANELDESNQILSRIVEGWEGRDGEEDLRIRSSALSVFGEAVDTNVAGLGSTLVSTGVDLSISILTLESGEERAILRRSAVLLIMSLIRALDKVREEGRRMGFGFAGENLESVIRVLRYVHATDNDVLVRDHANSVIEGLEVWRSKSILGLSASERGDTSPMLGVEPNRMAGLTLNPSEDSRNRPKIEEIE
ncbi:MAG: hypothetical protein M1837_006262 [Sclerophora amabilis]|nr:MAG: hypothetical protein M1837_006262 [Sclerophora amabilis]